MSTISPGSSVISSRIQLRMREEQAFLKRQERKDAERRRARTRRLVKEMIDQKAKLTPEIRLEAATARAATVHAKIDQIVAQADLERGNASTPLGLTRIDDLESLFAHRNRLPSWLRERIETVYAKVHWKKSDGRPDYFNVAVHKNHIPIDKTISILAHLKGELDGDDTEFACWVDAVLECGLFSKVRRGKFEYQRRCQDGEYCELCNYLNISDGVKTLYEAYDSSAFNRGGSWFGFTVAPRIDPAKAKAYGRVLTPADWDYENNQSVVYKEARCGRAFVYNSTFDHEEMDDWHVEDRIRRFLGAGQYIFGRVRKNGWLDGIRARVENSIQFLRFASHQHWHAVGSSRFEHDPQKMAEHIKEEIDEILSKTCPSLYADVTVAMIPSADDLRRWVKYMNKTVNTVDAVASVYNRHPGMQRNDPLFKEFMRELSLFPERSRRVFKMIRIPCDEYFHGDHTFMLRRRYVSGSHKFGEGSLLTESERHRLWRERQAERAARKRSDALERQMQRVLDVLDSRSTKRWPQNAINAADVQAALGFKSPMKAADLLRQMLVEKKLIARNFRPERGRPAVTLYLARTASQRSDGSIQDDGC